MRSARVPLAYIQRSNATKAQVFTAGSFAPPVFAASAMVGVMFTRLRRQGGLGLPADVTSQVELFAMGPTPSAMAVQKELSALPSGLISAAERQVARGDLSRPVPADLPYSPWVPIEAPWTPALLKHLRHVRWYSSDRFDGDHLEYWYGIAGQNCEDAWILEDERELRLQGLYIMEHVHPTFGFRVKRKTSPEDIASRNRL